MHGLRPEFQGSINFVVLDYDADDDYDLAQDLGVASHPAYAIVPPDGDSGDAARRYFGPQSKSSLRDIVQSAIEEYGAGR